MITIFVIAIQLLIGSIKAYPRSDSIACDSLGKWLKSPLDDIRAMLAETYESLAAFRV